MPIPLSVFAAAALAFLLPWRVDPAVLVAKILGVVVGAALVLVTAEALVARLRDRVAAARPRWELVVAALAPAVAVVGTAHAVLPRSSELAIAAARGLAMAASALVAAHGGLALAGIATRSTHRDMSAWRSRPIQSAVVRAAAVLFPIAASFSVAVGLDRTLPPPPSGVALVGRIVLVLTCSYFTLFLAERLVRRLGPLAMLLKLSLAFPGDTPSRFAIARRSRNPHALRQQLERARRGDDHEMSRVAETILALATALTSHDSRTRGHSERVRVFTDMLAEELRLSRGDRDRLRWAALMHDIGKLSVSPRILNKAGPLDRAQWRVMERHPEEGARIMSPLFAWLGHWGDAIAQHHERYDGSGYPNGIAGEDIAMGARIITVADAYDTMTAARPYKAAMTPAVARAEVERCAGSHFDPVVVRALLNLSIRRLWWRMGIASWLAQLPLLGRVPQAVAPVGEIAATGVRTAAAVAGVAAATALPGISRPASDPIRSPGVVTIQAAVSDRPAEEAADHHVEDHGGDEQRDDEVRRTGEDDGAGGGSGRGSGGGPTGGGQTGGGQTGGGPNDAPGAQTAPPPGADDEGPTGGGSSGGSGSSGGGPNDGGTPGGGGSSGGGGGSDVKPPPEEPAEEQKPPKPPKPPKPGNGPPGGFVPPGQGGTPPGQGGNPPPGHAGDGPGNNGNGVANGHDKDKDKGNGA